MEFTIDNRTNCDIMSINGRKCNMMPKYTAIPKKFFPFDSIRQISPRLRDIMHRKTEGAAFWRRPPGED